MRFDGLGDLQRRPAPLGEALENLLAHLQRPLLGANPERAGHDLALWRRQLAGRVLAEGDLNFGERLVELEDVGSALAEDDLGAGVDRP